MKSKSVALCLVLYSLSTTVDMLFSQNCILKNRQKKGIIFSKLRLLLYVKNWENFHHFFSLHPQKYFTKAFYCLLLKYLVKSFYYWLPIIIDLSYPKVLYKSVILSGKNVALRKLTSLIIPKACSKCILLSVR